MGKLKCDQPTSHVSKWPVNSHWDRYWIFFSCLTEVKKSRSVKNWHLSYYLLMLNTCYGPDNVQTSLLRLCNTELPRARLVCMVWANDLFIIVMEADRVLTMSVHSVKHITFSHSFSPRKNLLWHMLSVSHFINEEIEDQANCPWSHSDKWPNQGWITWLWSQTSPRAGTTDAVSWWRCWYYQSSCSLQWKNKTTYMEHLCSSP